MKNDETFRRALISLSVSIKHRHKVLSETQGELNALRESIPYLMPGLLDALEYPFLDAGRIAHEDAISKKLEAYFRKQTEATAQAHKEGLNTSEAVSATITRQLIESQEQERKRIARELHDNINQRLALLSATIEQLRDNVPPQIDVVRGSLAAIHTQIMEISKEVQSLSHGLHSSKLDYLGLIVAARIFCKEFCEQQKVKIDFRSQDLPSSVEPGTSLCLFRVLQEGLRNAARHSGANQFEVKLWGTTDEIHLTVSDSGTGFDLEEARNGPGLGLVSMHERVQMLKGKFSIESRAKLGTTIHARVPFSQKGSSNGAAG